MRCRRTREPRNTKLRWNRTYRWRYHSGKPKPNERVKTLMIRASSFLQNIYFSDDDESSEPDEEDAGANREGIAEFDAANRLRNSRGQGVQNCTELNILEGDNGNDFLRDIHTHRLTLGCKFLNRNPTLSRLWNGRIRIPTSFRVPIADLGNFTSKISNLWPHHMMLLIMPCYWN